MFPTSGGRPMTESGAPTRYSSRLPVRRTSCCGRSSATFCIMRRASGGVTATSPVSGVVRSRWTSRANRRRQNESPAAATHDLGVEALPFGAVVEHDLRVDEVRRDAVEHRGNLARRWHELALEHHPLSLADHEIVEQERRMRMGRALGDRNAIRPRYHRIDREPVDRRTVLLRYLGVLHVDRESDRHLAGGGEVGDHGMALAHRQAVDGHDIAEELEAALLAEKADYHTEPVVVVDLDAEHAFIDRVHEVGV